MFQKIKKIVASAVLGSVAIVGSAQASCWSAEALEAAEVRNLDTMLMVASLRCRITGKDFSARYNSFVRENRPLLVEANNRLRVHFDASGGLNAYDHYVTSIANRHGGGTAGQTCGEMEQMLKEARDEASSLSALARLGRSTGNRPPLPGGACNVTIAKAR